MVRLNSTTSIPVSQARDVPRVQESARRLGLECHLSETRLGDLTRVIKEQTEDLISRGGGFLRLTPIPSSVRLAVLVEAEWREGLSRCVVEAC